MAYTSIQLGEVLSLVTFRTDGFFGKARFSASYTAVLALNICALILVLYAPPVSKILDLAPLTLGNFGFALLAPALLICAAELTKVLYRSELAKKHAVDYGVFMSPAKEKDMV